jgi:hypothetical protein
MSLIKHTSTIAGFTVISRIFGFIRDMLLARVLGAGLAADAYQLAFTLPNTFRRLFAEGAFSVAFVPMYSRKLAGENGEEVAAEFADDVISVFIWVLLGFSALAMIAMPIIVYGLASEYQSVPGKFDLTVFLSRMTFPYLFFISLVAMLSGLLNARSRFAPGAIAPILFNLTLIGGIIGGYYLRGDSGDDKLVGGKTRWAEIADQISKIHARCQTARHRHFARHFWRWHLPDQPVFRHFLRHILAARFAHIAQNGRPAKPNAAGHCWHCAGHRNPAHAVALHPK